MRISITIILASRITLAKQKQLGMELIYYYRQRKFRRQNHVIIGDTEITDPREPSNAFNRHFTDIVPNVTSEFS